MNTNLMNREIVWLRRHGGRSAKDVIFDTEGKKYVLMGSPQGGEIVYLE